MNCLKEEKRKTEDSAPVCIWVGLVPLFAEYDTLNCAGDTSSPENFRTSPHAARALSTTGVESDLDATSVLNV